MLDHTSRFIGAYTGFAIGDAFGYPCRDMTFAQICERFEKKGCLRLAVSGKTNTALFSDATQMMLFTTDGVLWASLSQSGNEGVNYTEYVFYACQMWLYTQTRVVAGDEYTWLFDKSLNPYRSKLLKTKGLYRNRFSNTVNIELLSKMRNRTYGKLNAPINSLEDTGAIKRILPAGMFFNYDTQLAFRAGADFSAITHGGVSSYLASGFYSAVMAQLINGRNMDESVDSAVQILKMYPNHQKVLDVIEKVKEFLEDKNMSPLAAISHIGTDDNAAQALGIALFSATLFEDSFENAIRLATNHDGRSDVCGALCGGLLGAYHGAGFVPKKWLQKLSYLKLIEDVSISLSEVSYFEEETPEEEKDYDRNETLDATTELNLASLEDNTSEVEVIGAVVSSQLM
jgi:ADP-ribosylglycohydrolase